MSRAMDLGDDPLVVEAVASVPDARDTSMVHEADPTFVISQGVVIQTPDLRRGGQQNRVYYGIIPMIPHETLITKEESSKLVKKMNIYLQPCLKGQILSFIKDGSEVVAYDQEGFIAEVDQKWLERLSRVRVDFAIQAIVNERGMFVLDITSYEGDDLSTSSLYDRNMFLHNVAFPLGVERLTMAQDGNQKARLWDELMAGKNPLNDVIIGAVFKSAYGKIVQGPSQDVWEFSFASEAQLPVKQDS